MTYRYKLLLAITVDSDLQGHLSPIELRDTLIREANTVDELDDYIVLGTKQNSQYLTVLEEQIVADQNVFVNGPKAADFRAVGENDEPPASA